MDRQSALAVVAKELKLGRYKRGCWERAQCLARGSAAGPEGIYARLRMAELSSIGGRDSAGALSDVDRALRARANQSLLEAGAVFSMMLIIVFGSVRMMLG